MRTRFALGPVTLAICISAIAGAAACSDDTASTGTSSGGASSGGMSSGSSGSSSGTSGAGAVCEPLTRVEPGFGVDVCSACTKANCCTELKTCDGNDDCVKCSKNEAPVDGKACTGDPNFGLPDGPYNKLAICQGAKCETECSGVAGEACIPSDCAPSCQNHASGCQ